MPGYITPSDLLLATLLQADPALSPAVFERNSEFAKIFNDASEHEPAFQQFRWNPDYKSSKRLDEALNRLDLAGMVVGENMPTKRFRLSKQAKNYKEQLWEMLDEASRDQITRVAEKLGTLIAQS